MASFKVHVKWGKEKFSNIEVNTSEPPDVFQAQLFALSNVPPERQKIMAKGKTLKVDTWDGFPIKEGLTFLMMGSADALPTAPEQKTQFIEDMSDSQLAKATNIPAGLNNLGNTCYMNATVQCLKNVPELKDGLLKYNGQLGVGNILANPSEAITISLRDLFKMMDKTSDSLPPILFLQVLHAAFPHFAEKTEQGVFQQQDANECWTQLVRMLQQRLPPIKQDSIETSEQSSEYTSLIDQYFGIDFKTTMKCDEAPDEEEKISTERQYQLSCFISQEVKYMHTGLRLRLKETITKASPTLGKDATYTKTSLISRLPAYLTVQFVRFFYKEKEKVNAKILKDIKFPLELDVFDLCSPELQSKLQPIRDKFKEEDDKKLEKKINVPPPNKNGDAMDVDPNKKILPYSFDNDVGSNNSGYYELSAVLTHRGRSSSSGHYVGWVRRSGDEWLMCDDDNVVSVTSQDVLKLSGGGDWHCAYVLLYAPKKLTIEE